MYSLFNTSLFLDFCCFFVLLPIVWQKIQTIYIIIFILVVPGNSNLDYKPVAGVEKCTYMQTYSMKLILSKTACLLNGSHRQSK